MAKRLYVGNLSYTTTHSTLSELFAEIGEVVSVNLITDRMSGRSKGFAFVEMADNAEALAAINQLNGKEVDGRAIKVDEARPRRDDRRGDARPLHPGRHLDRRRRIGEGSARGTCGVGAPVRRSRGVTDNGDRQQHHRDRRGNSSGQAQPPLRRPPGRLTPMLSVGC